MIVPRPKPEHGTRSRYSNDGCRCEPCRQAEREYQEARRGPLKPRRTPPQHGTASCYSNLGCRCAPCRAAQSSRHKGYAAKNAEKIEMSRREWQMKRKYGMTVGEVRAMWAQQGGRCPLCLLAFPIFPGVKTQKRMLVDHDHKTGRVRGLLCDPCNQVLAKIGDSVGWAKRAIEYLSEVHIAAETG